MLKLQKITWIFFILAVLPLFVFASDAKDNDDYRVYDVDHTGACQELL